MKSFFLTSEFKNIDFINEAVLDAGKSYEIVSGEIKKETKTFEEVARLVISKLEGGYYNPKIHNTGDSRYSTSGETMFGIDRKAGGTTNTSTQGKAFWDRVDKARDNKLWRWNYIPPDPLQKELVDLAIKVIKPEYEKLANKFLSDKNVRATVEGDGRLFFNFVYAVWNGGGWFQGWAAEVSKAYKNGTTKSEDLLKLVVSRRVNNRNVLIRGNSQNSLIAQGGIKIKELVGLK